MIYPNRLHHKGTIGIYSPSEPITEERVPRFEKGISVLKSHGFIAKYGVNALTRNAYMAGTIKERVEDINALLTARDVNAIMASWGGKSCNQLLPYLDYKLIAKQRKPIMGFSDICVLLNSITYRTGLITFHGPNVAGKLYETKHSDLSLLIEPFKTIKDWNLLGNVEDVNTMVLRSGSAKGRLFGGNLSTFTLGFLGAIDIRRFDGCIFFWESGGEEIQIVDQFLNCLRNAGLFERLAGMIIGDFIKPDTAAYKKRDPFEMLGEILGRYKFPVLYCPTFGHPPELENPIIPIGALCSLDAKGKRLALLEPVTK
jgi:muramoyltetrapeptide carboxypeptidase